MQYKYKTCRMLTDPSLNWEKSPCIPLTFFTLQMWGIPNIIIWSIAPQGFGCSRGDDKTTSGNESQSRRPQQDHTAVCRSGKDLNSCREPCIRGGQAKTTCETQLNDYTCHRNMPIQLHDQVVALCCVVTIAICPSTQIQEKLDSLLAKQRDLVEKWDKHQDKLKRSE